MLENKYQQLMNKVQLSSEAQERIAQHVIAQQSPKKYAKGWWQMGSVLALVAVICGFLLLPQQESNERTLDHSQLVEEQRFTNADDLSQALGFAMEDVTPPFLVSETFYRLLAPDFGEIMYEGSEGFLIYRKQKGNTDPSGDYRVYSQERAVAFGQVQVTLKGENQLFYLALWTVDGYTSSIQVSVGLSQEMWLELLASFFEK